MMLDTSEEGGIRGRGRKNHAPATAVGINDEEGDLFASDDDTLLSSSASPTSSSHSATVPLSYVQAIWHWWTNMRLHFGDSLLLQIFFVYFTQGIRSTLCSLGTSYYLNETLALKPAESEALRGTAAIPWIIKPLYGMLSDSVPIWGTRRKSYLIIFSGVAAVAYIALSIPGVVTT